MNRSASGLPASAAQAHPLQALLARATNEARNAICITDADLDEPGPRIVYVNAAFTTITGYSSNEVLGRNPRILQGALTDRSVLQRLRSDLEAGRPFDGETWNYRKDGRSFRMAWRVTPVHDLGGEVTHYVAVQEDVTAVRQAEEVLAGDAARLRAKSDWLAALVRLSVTISRTSDPDRILPLVTDAAAGPLGADGAAIVVLDEERDDWILACSTGFEEAPQGERSDPVPDSLIGQALQRRVPLFLASSPLSIGAGLVAPDGALAVLPLGERELAWGVLVLRWQDRSGFRPMERTHLGLLAQLTTLTHHKTQDLVDQRSLAEALQQFLLPRLADLDGYQLATRYRPADDVAVVGGDWFDLVCLKDQRLAVFVGDVVGHGSEAAALMGEIRYTIRGLLRAFTEPGELLDELDAALLASHEPGEALATMCVVIIDTDGSMDYCSAGHPYPVIRRADGSIDLLEGAQCRLVGASAEGDRREAARAALAPGDCLIAFSDGVFEERDQDYDDSYDDLIDRLQRAEATPESLCDAAVSRPETMRSFRDDIVVLALAREPETEAGV